MVTSDKIFCDKILLCIFALECHESTKGAVDATYTAHYDANIRKLSVTTDKGLSQTGDVPKELKRLYVGQMANVGQRKWWGDHDSVTLSTSAVRTTRPQQQCVS